MKQESVEKRGPVDRPRPPGMMVSVPAPDMGDGQPLRVDAELAVALWPHYEHPAPTYWRT
jgi:hypothetical protein